MAERSRRERIAAVASILEPSRELLYSVVRSSDHPLGVDEIARAAGIPRTTAALHLDRLAQAGLLDVELQRRSGRTGPGAGRPAKLYVASAREDVASVPERDYELMGDILATAIDESMVDGSAVAHNVVLAANRRGRELGTGRPLAETLAAAGYEPRAAADGSMVLENCPFHRLAAGHTDLVCSANLAMLEGVIEASGDGTLAAVPVAAGGRCCVSLARVS